ncbi:MAG TPA: MarR family transcriptional regulator [Solirubrobacteraceae bacterium]|nr:MarR family transcriptional regulator [Solirubrobacteraceae bacterium]
MTPRRAHSFQIELEDSIARVIAGWHAARPDLPVEPIAITARLARLQAHLAPRLEEVFVRFGLRGSDFAVLATLVRLEGETISQRRLGAELGLSPGTISLRIDRLVGRGLVERETDPDDGRGAVISITRQGRELFEACAPEHLTNAGELLSGLADEERDQLGRLLGKLLYTLEDTAAADDPLAPELGLVLEGAPMALERRRAVGLPPLEGLLVRHVDPGGPAAASGIRPGDLLTSADRRPLRSRGDLQLALQRSRGRLRPIALEVTRGAEPMRVALSFPK